MDIEIELIHQNRSVVMMQLNWQKRHLWALERYSYLWSKWKLLFFYPSLAFQLEFLTVFFCLFLLFFYYSILYLARHIHWRSGGNHHYYCTRYGVDTFNLIISDFSFLFNRHTHWILRIKERLKRKKKQLPLFECLVQTNLNPPKNNKHIKKKIKK